MTSTASFKDKFKQAFSFFQWELKSCAGTLTIYSILTAVFTVIILTMCLVIGFQADANAPQDAFESAGTALSNSILPELSELNDYSAMSLAKAIFRILSSYMVCYMTLIFTVIYTIKVFSYMHNKRQTDMYGSMPISRITLFFSKSATAFIFSVVPAIVFLGIITLISVVLGQPLYGESITMIGKIVMGSLACISAYGLIAICCGTTINSIIMFIVISVAYPLSAYLVRGVMDSFFIGSSSEYLNNSFIMNAFCPLSAYGGANVIYWLIFTIVCLAASAYLVKNRRAERAQSSFAYYLPCHIVKVLVSFLAGMFLGVLFGSLNVFGYGYAGFVFGFILASIPAFIVCHLIFYHGFHKLVRTSVSLGALIVVTVGAMALINFDVTGYNKYVPSVDDIESVGFIDSENCYLSESETSFLKLLKDANADFTDESSISNAVELHKYIIEKTDNSSSSKFVNTWIKTLSAAINFDLYDYKAFSYKMTNGDLITRKFNVSSLYSTTLFADDYEESDVDYENIKNLAEKLVCTKEYQLKYSAFMNADSEEISYLSVYVERTDYKDDVLQYEYNLNGITGDKNSNFADDRKKILEAYKKDFEADTKDVDKALYYIVSKDYYFGIDDESAVDLSDCVCVIDAEFLLNNATFYGVEELVVPKSYTNTIQALKDAEILDSEGKPMITGPYYNEIYSQNDYYEY